MTHKILGALAAVALLVGAGVADAQTWRGKVEAVNNPNGTFTVTGREFVAGERLARAPNRLPTGANVVVSYERRGGENVATRVRYDKR